MLFWVLLQLVALLVLFFFWEAGKLNKDAFPKIYNQVMPIAVPWFGAMGGIANALYSLSIHWFKWDSPNPHVRWPERRRWNAWALLQGIVGALFGTVSVLIVVLVTGTIASSTSGGLNLSATGIGLLCAVAFTVGFRQATFQELIKRAVEVIAGPGTGSTDAVSFTVAPDALTLITTRGNPSDAQQVQVTNLGSSLLVLWGANVTVTQPTPVFRVTLPGNLASGEAGQISVIFDPQSDPLPASGHWVGELGVSVEGVLRKVALTGTLYDTGGGSRDSSRPAAGKKEERMAERREESNAAKKAARRGDADQNGANKAAAKQSLSRHVADIAGLGAGWPDASEAAATETARARVTKGAAEKTTDAALTSDDARRSETGTPNAGYDPAGSAPRANHPSGGSPVDEPNT